MPQLTLFSNVVVIPTAKKKRRIAASKITSPPPMMNVRPNDTLVLRFWHSYDAKKLPDKESIRNASSWSNFRQIIYSNVPESLWKSIFMPFNVSFVLYDSSVPGLNLSPQCLKDRWQFTMAKHHGGALCVDFDFVLVNESTLPLHDAIIMATEWVKCAPDEGTGGQYPREIIRQGVRAHFGLTKFPFMSPIAKEIQDAIEDNLPKMHDVTKTIKKESWLSNVLIAQRIMMKHNYAFPDPVVFNPFPHWMKSTYFGQLLFNTPMPTVTEAHDKTASITTWSGYPHFHSDVILNHFSHGMCSYNELGPESDDDIISLLDSLHFPESHRAGTIVKALNIGVVKPRGSAMVELSSFTRNNPETVKRLIRWAQLTIVQACGPQDFAGLYITKQFPLEARHRDTNNRGRKQIWRAIGVFNGGELMHWPKDAGGDTISDDLKYLKKEDANTYDGKSWTVLDLTRAHEVADYDGHRYGLICYVPASIDTCRADVIKQIIDMGFPYVHKQMSIMNFIK